MSANEDRWKMWRNGFRPVPVLKDDKAPLGRNWTELARRDPPDCLDKEVTFAPNTGSLCDGLRLIDLDVDDRDKVTRIGSIAFAHFGSTIVRWRENSARCALVYRAAEGEPGKVALTGTAGKIEILGRGQQFVALGHHPTGAEWLWHNGYSPLNRARDTLPAITEEQLRAFLEACAPIIGAAPPTPPPQPKLRVVGGTEGQQGDFFATVNSAALEALGAWVTVLFPAAIYQTGTGAYRVSSAERGRPDLEEDISFHPDGIQDFGLEEGLTPIDAVIQHGGAPDAVRAALWLCERMGVDPVGWGWRKTGAGAGGPPPVGPPVDPPEPPDREEPPPNENIIVDAGANITEQFAMRLFVEGHVDTLRFNHSSTSWMVWAEHYWKHDERKMAFSWSLNLCRQLSTTIEGKGADLRHRVVEKISFSGAVETGARAMPPLSTSQTDWDANLRLLGTPGGVVDLTTGLLRPGQRPDMVSRTTNATPSQSPDCPTWMAFLDYAFYGDDQLIRFTQRYFGYCLTGLTSEEVFVFMFGVAGAGKGTMIETIAHILGDYAGTVPMEVFTGKSWSPTEYYRADMAGKRLIVANEPERDAHWAEAFVKETTGGDTLSGRFPMGRVFRFKPTHKFALQGNHMPRLQGRSTGMERRLCILPFNRKPTTPDRALKAKLLAEAPGILRWLIEGCLAWQNIGLNPPDAVRLANTKYFDSQNAFGRWIDECCILDRNLELPPATLRKSFNEWADANGEDKLNGNAFAEAIDQYEPAAPNTPLRRGMTNGKRWVRGIGLQASNTTGSWNNT